MQSSGCYKQPIYRKVLDITLKFLYNINRFYDKIQFYLVIPSYVLAIIPFPVAIEKRIHLYTYRTQKLSFSSSKILGWRRPGKIEHCWNIRKASARGCFFVINKQWQCSGTLSVRFVYTKLFPDARDEKVNVSCQFYFKFEGLPLRKTLFF